MGNSRLRKHIRDIISELFGGAAVYAQGVNKFPYFDGTDAKTPADLDAEFDAELAPLPNEIEEFSENKDNDSRFLKVPTFDGKKKGSTIYKIPNKHL